MASTVWQAALVCLRPQEQRLAHAPAAIQQHQLGWPWSLAGQQIDEEGELAPAIDKPHAGYHNQLVAYFKQADRGLIRTPSIG